MKKLMNLEILPGKIAGSFVDSEMDKQVVE